MAQAPIYTQVTDFSIDEYNGAGGRSTVGTAKLDAELTAVAASVNALRSNLSLIQRDDGQVRDLSVTIPSLSVAVAALLTATAGATYGPWLTATAYTLKSVVTNSGRTYICASAHTSGTFATDLAANKWILVAVDYATVDTISGSGLVENNINLFAGATTDIKFAAAKAALVKSVRFPAGSYTTAGLSIAAADTIERVHFDPGSVVTLTAASNAIGLDIQKAGVTVTGKLTIKSSGTKGDGLNTIGVRIGVPTAVSGIAGVAYVQLDHVKHENFSARGIVAYQPVYLMLNRVDGLNSTYGVSIEPAYFASLPGYIGGTTVIIGPSYQSGCTRAINLEKSAWVDISLPITEYCGSSSTTDGALHFKTSSDVTVRNFYGEVNARNWVRDDTPVTMIDCRPFTATAADVVSYAGTSFDRRGVVEINSEGIKAQRINANTRDTQDLTIGTNLVVPVAGGSVKFGRETMLEYSGTLTSATWTTVATIPSTEISGTNGEKAHYEYVCYAGLADLGTGFDAGTVYNATLRSYSGATPAWLRLSSNLIQMNVTNTSYGLTYRIVLRRIFPGT